MRAKSLFFTAIIIITSTACQIVSTLPSPHCRIEDLLLDESVFHKDFRRSWPSEDGAPMRFGIDKIGVTFSSMTKGGAIQSVYLGGSVNETRRQFTDFVGEFSSRKGWTEWYTPDTFAYQSSVADQYRFACYRHIESGVETCQAIGQYGPYLIQFYTKMSEILTYQDLEHMLQTIDEKAVQCLGK